MKVKVEAFLDLEESLTARLNSSFRAENAGVIGDALRAVKDDDYEGAIEIVEGISFSDTVAENFGYIKLVGLQSVLYGAAQAGNVRDNSFVGNPEPLEVDLAANVLALSLMEHSRYTVIRGIQKALYKESNKQKDAQVVQKADPIFTKAFVPFATGMGQAQIQVGASLHNSRMSQFGFITEAQLLDITNYRVNEQLDTRTCPVCKLMHNKVFEVSTASTKLEQWLSIEDPEDFKTAAPWPSQTKQGIADLESMTIQQVQEAGWDTPPYHPLCRGQLAKTTRQYRSDATIGGGPALGDAIKLPVNQLVLRPAEEVFSPAVPTPIATTPTPLSTITIQQPLVPDVITDTLIADALANSLNEKPDIEDLTLPILGKLLSFL